MAWGDVSSALLGRRLAPPLHALCRRYILVQRGVLPCVSYDNVITFTAYATGLKARPTGGCRTGVQKEAFHGVPHTGNVISAVGHKSHNITIYFPRTMRPETEGEGKSGGLTHLLLLFLCLEGGGREDKMRARLLRRGC